MKEILETSPEFQSVRSLVENCVQSTPVIVLGSGASAAHGIYTMDSLADSIVARIEETDLITTYRTDWDRFKKTLSATSNLERSLESIENNEILVKSISQITWNLICARDKSVFTDLLNGTTHLPLSKIIQALSNGTGATSHLKIITTNYDRLAEYACDFVRDSYAEFIHYTGFSYGLLRRPDDQFNTVSRVVARRVLNRSDGGYPSRIKPVEILKVHGSLDWFETQSGDIISIPTLDIMPNDTNPAIITPGKTKYQKTHSHPYSMIIERARKVLEETNHYMVIGFGFRDKHIHDNLERKFKNGSRSSTFLVIAKNLTEETKRMFLSGVHTNNFVLIESDGGKGSTIHKKDRNDKDISVFVIKDKEFWDLNIFHQTFLG